MEAPSRPQAMEGSPEGRVPLALSAQDRPPRRRSKRQGSTRTRIKPLLLIFSRRPLNFRETLV